MPSIQHDESLIDSNAIDIIRTPLPFSEGEVDINLDGKNLIITGNNGCGKTKLLDHIYKYLHGELNNKSRTVHRDKVNLHHFHGHYDAARW